MIAGALTWPCYGTLLERLLPGLEHAMLARADGAILWESDPGAVTALQPTLAILRRTATTRPGKIDGLADPLCVPGWCCGFRVRGALGEILGYLLVRSASGSVDCADLAGVHQRLRPVLDCLQSELAERAASGELPAHLAGDQRLLDLYQALGAQDRGEGTSALGRIADLALDRLNGLVAALVLSERRISICRAAPSAERSSLDAGALAQLHRHLLTRVQLHACTLVSNRLAVETGGAQVPYKAISTPILDEIGRVVGVLAIFRADADRDFDLHDAEVLELLARKAAAVARASFDPHTGLLSGAALREEARQLAARNTSTCAHGVLFIDIDQLASINELHGMGAGDEVVREIAALLASKARSGVLAAHIEQDRFAMLVPGCGVEPAARVAEELRGAAVALSRTIGEQPRRVSLSIGVARLGSGADPLGEALAAAESACRNAKAHGRNRVEFHAGARDAAARTTAWSADPLELFVQPVLPLGAMTADPRFEVLLRVRGADGALQSYARWAPRDGDPQRARRTDLWVVENAIARLAANREALRAHPASFWVNLSAETIGDAAFWRELEDRLQSSPLPAGTLGFEMAEADIDGLTGRLAAPMLRLRERGVGFALDHFGRATGSLANLRALPFTAVKIDGSFCRAVTEDPRARSMVLAVVQLAHAFDLDAIATHVESDAVRKTIVDLGADFGQGFLIGRPCALAEALGDLPLYSCFSTSTGLFDQIVGRSAARA